MIALDTSSVIAYLQGETGIDTDHVEYALAQKQAVFPPIVLSELLSDPTLSAKIRKIFEEVPLLEIDDGYWRRVGLLRAKLLSQGLKARLADSLIAQSCLDHGVPLVTRDSDFRHFANRAGLKVFV